MKPLFQHIALLALLGLSACGASRPDVVLCGIDYETPQSAQFLGTPGTTMQMSVDMAETMMADTMRDAITSGTGPVTIEVLALSAGGQFGSFGAGFLRGWAENPVTPRPEFRLVTGVSAGAILAPVVFAGRDFDAALDGYRGLDEPSVFRSRGALSLLAAPSFADPAPLEDFLDRQLTRGLITAIERQHRAGRGLLVLATDLDSTEAAIFDLGAMAASTRSEDEKRRCMREAMLASSAIPGLFPPRHIDGTLFADGGLRDQIFLRSLENVRRDIGQETGREIRVSATVVINGSLRAPETVVDDGLLPYARRGAVVLADEVLRDSIAEVVTFAQSQPNWRVRGILADTDLSACGNAAIGGTFDACVTTTLFDDGRDKGRMSSIPWLAPGDLLDLAARL